MTHLPKLINGPLQRVLRENNLKLTQARTAVFEALYPSQPQTIAEILKACHGSVDRVSVYRTIKLYEKLGVVQRLHSGWKYKLELNDRFRPNYQHHHHMTCNNCEEVIGVLGDQILEMRLHEVAKSRNFIMQEHQVEIRGLCPTCALKQGLDPFK